MSISEYVKKARFRAEGVGFEPTEALRLQRFSRPPHSSALPPLRSNKHRALSLMRESSGNRFDALTDAKPDDAPCTSVPRNSSFSIGAVSYLRRSVVASLKLPQDDTMPPAGPRRLQLG